jgi:hypothetical protein
LAHEIKTWPVGLHGIGRFFPLVSAGEITIRRFAVLTILLNQPKTLNGQFTAPLRDREAMIEQGLVTE